MKISGLIGLVLLGGAVLSLTGTDRTARAQLGPSDFDASVQCSAFQRWGNGGWTATESTMLEFDNGTALSVAPGQSFAAGSTTNGIAIPVILDRHCGNL
jgi:hypothetical protein